MIVVGVFAGDTRYHDMTPPPDDSAMTPDAGGAPAFLKFLSTELVPYIAARYRTHPTTVLMGHSLTGYFTTWAFGHAPQFVTGGIALSPTPNLDGLKSAGRQVFEGLMSRTTAGRLFILTSTSEDGLDSANSALAAKLRARRQPPWQFEHQRITGASHGTTEIAGVVPGLRFVFRPASLDGLMWHNDGTEASVSKLIVAFDSARAVYVHGADELHLPPRLPFLWLINQSNALSAPSVARLRLHLCEAAIDFYPTRWNGFECAGDTEMQLGRQREAAVNYRRGAEAARTAGDSAAADRMVRKQQGLRGPNSGRP
jgi:pimeloyl-ACP methyl ester carboxylesterase